MIAMDGHGYKRDTLQANKRKGKKDGEQERKERREKASIKEKPWRIEEE